MFEFSPAEGFVEINENLGDMIKFIANEPSVGLYYIQQHSQNAIPNVTHLTNSLSDKSREVLLQAEDLDDSIDMVHSMKECGFSIADEMIKDMKKSLIIMSSKRPKRGLIGGQQSWSFWAGGTSGSGSGWGGGRSGWSSSSSSSNIRGGINNMSRESRTGSGYLKSVFKNARETAEGFKWPQLDLKELKEMRREWGSVYEFEAVSDRRVVGEGDEVGVCSGETGDVYGIEKEDEFAGSEALLGFDSFKAERESKLEEWLEGDGGSFGRI